MDNTVKYANMQEVKAVDTKERIIEFIASKEIPDFDGDIVKLDGMDITKIKKNKSFLWSHDQRSLPIGKLLRVWKDGDVLKGKAQLTSEEENSFGYSVYKLIKGGFINNISISFLPDWTSVEYKEDKKSGLSTRIIGKSTLLEISAVNIGANPSTSIEVKTLKENFDKAWDAGELNGTELNALNDSIMIEEEEVVDKVIDYDSEIKALREEIEGLKDGSYLYSMFEWDNDEEDNKDKMYEDMLEEYK